MVLVVVLVAVGAVELAELEMVAVVVMAVVVASVVDVASGRSDGTRCVSGTSVLLLSIGIVRASLVGAVAVVASGGEAAPSREIPRKNATATALRTRSASPRVWNALFVEGGGTTEGGRASGTVVEGAVSEVMGALVAAAGAVDVVASLTGGAGALASAAS